MRTAATAVARGIVATAACDTNGGIPEVQAWSVHARPCALSVWVRSEQPKRDVWPSPKAMWTSLHEQVRYFPPTALNFVSIELCTACFPYDVLFIKVEAPGIQY